MPVIHAVPTHAQQSGLPADTQAVGAVHERRALGNRPAVLRAPSRKSFSRVNGLIFACSVVTSHAGTAAFFTPRHRQRPPPPRVGPFTA